MIHPTADVSKDCFLGDNTKVWNNVQIREGVTIGSNCILSKDVYIDHHVQIGNGCKIQNGVSVYSGVTIEDFVFVGPNVTFTNDRFPRAFNSNWRVTPTLIKKGSSLGANSTVVCGHVLGEYCMVAAGAVVTKDVPPYALVAGNPAVLIGFVCDCGFKLDSSLNCPECNKQYRRSGQSVEPVL